MKRKCMNEEGRKWRRIEINYMRNKEVKKK